MVLILDAARREACKIRQGTSSQYQYCYLDLIIGYYLSAQPIPYKCYSEAAMPSGTDKDQIGFIVKQVTMMVMTMMMLMMMVITRMMLTMMMITMMMLMVMVMVTD